MRLTLLVTGWLLAAATIGHLAFEYAATPGLPAAAPARWPTASALPHPASKPSLLLFLHPRCPCSAASVDELKTLLAEAPQTVDAVIVFAGDEPAVRDSALWRSAAAIPGVIVVADAGIEQERFGARTSGETLLFAADGGLLFHGGITAGRGHRGENPGRLTIGEFVAHPAAAGPVQCPVYGCPLTARLPRPSADTL